MMHLGHEMAIHCSIVYFNGSQVGTKLQITNAEDNGTRN